MKLYIKSVAHNFKGDVPHPPARLQLAPKTIITGRNGVGHKSAPVQAIHAALTAEVDGVNGKNGVVDPATLIKFAPDRDKPDAEARAAVVVGFAPDAYGRADGQEFTSTWSLMQTGGKVRQAVHTPGVRATLPRRLVGKLMYGDVKQARASMLSICALVGIGGQLDLESLAGEVPLHLQAKFRDIATRMAAKHGIADVLGETAAYADDRMRELNREAKAAQQASVSIETRAAEQQKAQGARRLNDPVRMPHREPNQIQAEIEEAESGLDQWREAEQAILDQLAQVSVEDVQRPANLPGLIRDVLSVHLSSNDAAGRDACPVCTSPVGRDFLASTLAWAEERADAPARRVRAETGLRGRVEADLREATDAIQEWNTVLAARKAELAAAETEARAAVLSAASLRDQPGPAEMARAARQEAAAKEAEADVYRQLKVACNDAAVRLLQSRATAFAEIANLYVPPEFGQLGVTLEDQGRQVLDIGLIRSVSDSERARNVLHVLLSDVERVVVESAVARMLAEAHIRKAAAKNEPLLVLLDPEDRSWDRQTLIAAMRCWSDFPGQVIVTVSEAPWQSAPLSDRDDAKVPAGWLWVDRDRDMSIEGGCEWDVVARHVAQGARERAVVLPQEPAPVQESILTAYPPACLALALEVFDASDRQAARRKGRVLAEKHADAGAKALLAVVAAHKGAAVVAVASPGFAGAAGEIEAIIDLLFPALRRGRKAGARAKNAESVVGEKVDEETDEETDEEGGKPSNGEEKHPNDPVVIR